MIQFVTGTVTQPCRYKGALQSTNSGVCVGKKRQVQYRSITREISTRERTKDTSVLWSMWTETARCYEIYYLHKSSLSSSSSLSMACCLSEEAFSWLACYILRPFSGDLLVLGSLEGFNQYWPDFAGCAISQSSLARWQTALIMCWTIIFPQVNSPSIVLYCINTFI